MANASPPVEAVDRDREQARLTVVVMIAWVVIWTAIIVSLFVFGETLASIAV